MSHPPGTPLPPSSPSHPSRLSQSTGFEFPVSYIKLPLAIYLTYGNVYVSMLFSHIIPPSPSLTVSKMSVSPLLPCKWDHQYYLSRFHIYALVYDICLSVSDLLHSIIHSRLSQSTGLVSPESSIELTSYQFYIW